MMIFSWVLTALIGILNLTLGSLVLIKNPRNKVNQFFFGMVFFATVWMTAHYLSDEALKISFRSLFLRLDFALATFLVFFFLLFCVTFSELSLKKTVKTFLAILTTVFAIFPFSNYLIKDIEIADGTIIFKTGVAFLPYVLFIIGSVGFGCRAMVNFYRKSVGLRKDQSLYVLTGLLLTASIIVVLDLFLPQFIFIPLTISRIAIFSLIFFIFFTFYAIVSRHLFDIRVILTEILVGVIALILFIQTLVADFLWLKILNGVVLILFCVFGYFLIRTTIREIELRREVEKLSNTKSEFLSIASHQLRTPLAAIKGYISMILEGSYGELNEKVKGPMESVYQSNERLIKLVNDLLNLSRLDAGKIKFEPQPTSLEEMVKGIIEELRITIENKGLYIKMKEPQLPLPEVMVDRDHIRQVILNILDNAVKYTQKGGITVELSKIDNTEQIKISDTGEGMDERELAGLFQMFSRATAGAQFHTEGAGIGLYIVRKFVEMHKGRIYAESKGKGKGSTFYIELPTK